MVQRMMRPKAEVLVTVWLLSIYQPFHWPIFPSDYWRVSKNGICLSSSSAWVNLMLPVGSMMLMWSVRLLTWPFFISSKASSTYRFQNFGLHSTGAAAIVYFSNFSINNQLSHTWDQVISRSHAPSSCKQPRSVQDDGHRNFVIT